jgi:hypothetical protein
MKKAAHTRAAAKMRTAAVRAARIPSSGLNFPRRFFRFVVFAGFLVGFFCTEAGGPGAVGFRPPEDFSAIGTIQTYPGQLMKIPGGNFQPIG